MFYAGIHNTLDHGLMLRCDETMNTPDKCTNQSHPFPGILGPPQDHSQVQSPVKNLCVTWELTTTSEFKFNSISNINTLFYMEAYSCM